MAYVEVAALVEGAVEVVGGAAGLDAAAECGAVAAAHLAVDLAPACHSFGYVQQLPAPALANLLFPHQTLISTVHTTIELQSLDLGSVHETRLALAQV